MKPSFKWREKGEPLTLSPSSVVGKRKGEKLSVDYSKLSVIALKAVDKLYEENTELKEKLNSTEKRLETMEKLYNELINKLGL